MRFNSVQFLIFFPIVVLGYFAVPQKAKNIWLLIASYYFYMSWQPVYALLIFFSTATTFVFAALIDQSQDRQKRKLFLFVNVFVNIAILFYFKYFNFFVQTVTGLVPGLSLSQNNNLVAVVGISFYTFQSLGYTIDVYRGKVKREKNFLTYMLFVSFFPQLVAGPIERSENLLPQLHRTYKFKYDRVKDGLVLMAWGFFKKMVIADGAALIVDYVYNDVYNHTAGRFIIATFLFAFQIYCDFSGYSDIAIGAANVIGIRLMRNFYHPYFSQDVAEFWRRWHISLNGWFTDYIYIPLGGSRRGFARTCINILVVYFVSGLWHGAAWTFVIWGLLNGVYNIVHRLVAQLGRSGSQEGKAALPVVRALKIAGTFVLIDFSWIFFRANTLENAFYIIGQVFAGLGKIFSHGFFAAALESVNFAGNNGMAVILCIIFMIVVEIWEGKSTVDQRVKKCSWFVRWPFYYSLVLLILFFGVFGQSRFIYFQF